MKKVRDRLSKLRDMDPSELDGEAADLRQKVWSQSLQQATGQLQDRHKVGVAKRELARVLTVKRERELAQAKGRSGGGR